MVPAVVVPVQPAGGRVFDVGDGLVRAVVEHRRADAFGFVESSLPLHSQRMPAPQRGSAPGG